MGFHDFLVLGKGFYFTTLGFCQVGAAMVDLLLNVQPVRVAPSTVLQVPMEVAAQPED